MEQLRNAKGFICDMDGVIYHGNKILPGVKEFVEWLYRENKQFLFLTNNSGKTPKELQEKLARMGLDVDEHHFYTSALATAEFISRQSPGAHAFVIGEPGLYNALYEKGITLDDTNPDYVVIGESPKPIEMVTGQEAYYIGKPNPLMMRTGLNMLGVHSSEAVMIGDRMDTDIVTGIESGLDTVLVLSGVSTRETVKLFPYRPRLILNGVGDIPG